MSFFKELKRRNVFRVAIAYALAAWVLLQVIDFILDAIAAPNWILQVFILAAAVGFLAVLVFSWVFEVTSEGIKREKDIDRTQSIAPQTGRKLDRVIIAFLAVAVVLLLADRFVGTESVGGRSAADSRAERAPTYGESTNPTVGGRSAADSRAERAPTYGESTNPTVGGRSAAEIPVDAPASSAKSIAVLPFLALSSGPDDEYFADGLTDEILNALAQLPELLVTARTSAFHFKGRDIPIQEIAATLGVRNIVEGSVRRSGDRLRVTAQLIRAEDGFHLWSENYDSTSVDTIAVQEDIAEQIATAMDVVIDENKREAMRRSGLRDVEAFIAMQKGMELSDMAHGDPAMIAMLQQANDYFERVQERVPTYPPAWQLHSDVYIHQLMNGASGQPDGVTAPGQVKEALARATEDYQAAARHARTPEERNGAELDRAFVAGDWQGMPARIERFAAERGCSEPLWYGNITLPFGYAKKILPRSREFTVCDPLSSSAWRGEARALLWAGEHEAALATALQGSEQAPGAWLNLQLIFARVALAQFEQAEAEIATLLQLDSDKLSARMLLAAARGDGETVARLLEQYQQDPQASDYWWLIYYGWGGKRDEANEVAARIDTHAFGSQALSTILLVCLCGDPWDLSGTPNFTADMTAAGLPWPPSSPIHFPLKNR